MRVPEFITGLGFAIAPVLLFGPAQAQDRYVPSQYPTIKAALDVPGSNFTLHLEGPAPGESFRIFPLVEPIEYDARSIVIKGAGRSLTILDGSALGAARAIVFDDGEGPSNVLRDLSVRLCAGGAVEIEDSGPLLFNVHFEYNGLGLTSSGGGAILATESSANLLSARIENCSFIRNVCLTAGGGILVEGVSQPGAPFGSSLSILDCWFEENHARQGGGLGVFWRIAPTIQRCEFFENLAFQAGGGIYLREVPGGLIEECAFQGNIARDGGGLNYFILGAATIRHCTFAENSAIADLPLQSHGGGIYGFHDPEFNINDPTFGFPSIHNCLIIGNDADSGGGAFFGSELFHIQEGARPDLRYLSVTQNHARVEAGGIRINRPRNDFAIYASILHGNTGIAPGAPGPWLKELHSTGVHQPRIFSCDIEGSSAPGLPWIVRGIIDQEPVWATGPVCKTAPIGVAYLSQIPLQAAPSSPCVNFFPRQVSGQPIAGRTTRTDSLPDTGLADIGFHYPAPCY